MERLSRSSPLGEGRRLVVGDAAPALPIELDCRFFVASVARLGLVDGRSGSDSNPRALLVTSFEEFREAGLGAGLGLTEGLGEEGGCMALFEYETGAYDGYGGGDGESSREANGERGGAGGEFCSGTEVFLWPSTSEPAGGRRTGGDIAGVLLGGISGTRQCKSGMISFSSALPLFLPSSSPDLDSISFRPESLSTVRREETNAASVGTFSADGDLATLSHASPAAFDAVGLISFCLGLSVVFFFFLLSWSLASELRSVVSIGFRLSGLDPRDLVLDEEFEFEFGDPAAPSPFTGESEFVFGNLPGIVGGFDRSVYPTAGIVPSAIQPGVAGVVVVGLGWAVATPAVFSFGISFPLKKGSFACVPASASFLLSCKACSRSTRSRHWISSWRIDSCRAFSVSVLGVNLEGRR